MVKSRVVTISGAYIRALKSETSFTPAHPRMCVGMGVGAWIQITGSRWRVGGKELYYNVIQQESTWVLANYFL